MNQKPGEEPAHVSGQANSPMSAPAHALSFQQVAEELNANLEDGLTTEEAKRRLSQYGSNEFGEQEGVQPVKILLGQVANALTLVRCPITPPLDLNTSNHSCRVKGFLGNGKVADLVIW
jgi:magnesium-transporting ATPase (P-type)